MAEDTTKVKKELPFGLSEEQVLSLLKTVEDLKKKDVERDEEIKRLTYAADRNRLEKYQAQQSNKESLVPRCKVSLWEDKIIVASRMLPQEVYFDNAGVYHEKQLVEMYLQGETDPVVVAYKDQFRRVEKKDAQITGKKIDSAGHEVLSIQLNDGRMVDLDSNFIN